MDHSILAAGNTERGSAALQADTNTLFAAAAGAQRRGGDNEHLALDA